MTSTVNSTYDEVKQQQLSKYEADLHANSIWQRRNFYPTHLIFNRVSEKDKDNYWLKLFLNLDTEKKIQDTLYFVFEGKKYPLLIEKIKYSLKEGENTHTENKIIKSKDKKKKEIITTDVYTHHYKYHHTQLKVEIPAQMLSLIKVNEQMRIRLYIDDEAYNLDFNNFLMNKIRKVYSVDNQEVSVNP